MTHNYHNKNRRKKSILQAGIVVFILLAVCIIAVIVLAADRTPVIQYTSAGAKTGAANETVTGTGAANDTATGTSSHLTTEQSTTIELNGETYIPKKNIETYLFMGIDDPNKVQKRDSYDGTGQCDVVMLLVRDKSAGTYQTLTLDRNTMMDVKSLDIDGSYLATTKNQLALAHSDGDGLEISCENVVDAVSNFLYGQKIDGYAAVNMGCIGIINQLIGGVTVTIEDDFSEIDSSLRMGETITLNDEQAVHYIRGRKSVGDETNASRLRRQSVYLAQAEEKLRELCAEDGSFPLKIYEALEEYMVTDISSQKFSKIAMLAVNDKSEGSLKLEGETIIGEMDFEEFWADQESLEQVIAQLFYKSAD